MERDELFRFRRYVQFNALPEDRNALVCVLVLILSCCICMVFFFTCFLCEKRRLGTAWVLKWPCLPGTAQLLQWSPLVWLITESRLIGVIRVIFLYFLRVRVCVLSVHPPVLCSTFKTAVELCCIWQSCPVAVFPVGWREQRAALSVSHPEPRGSYLSASACCCVPLEELRGEALWLMTQ